jgi:integrase
LCRRLGHAADSAGLNPPDQARLRVHDLRHTFASHLIIDLKLDVAQVSRESYRRPPPRKRDIELRNAP